MIDMHWDHGWNGGAGAGWWIFMGVMMLVFWGGLAWVVVTLIRRGGSPTHLPPAPPAANTPPARPRPEDILHERLARGEIDVDEYRERIDALRATQPH